MTGRRLASLLLALVAVLGLSVSAPQTARADGPIGDSIEAGCRIISGPILGTILPGNAGGKAPGRPGSVTGWSGCDAVGKVGEEKVREEWNNIMESLLGDVIKSGVDVAKWVIKKTLTFALLGPSVDLAGTGLWTGDTTLAGMLTWLGLVIAVAGVIWNLGRMALTGQGKYAGRAMAGWVENFVLSFLGVSLFASLLVLGDALSAGLVNAVFKNDAEAYDRIVTVMLPTGVSNPMTLLCIVLVLLLVGFVQMVMIFLRLSAIPIICLLIPVAGGGRTGGEATRKWAPALITAGMVIVAYKPMVAVIICTGFAEFGEAKTLTEWLRGCATLVLAVLAPGPLTKVFAPFGAAAGAGLSAGGASGALSAAASYFGGKSGAKGDKGSAGEGGDRQADAIRHMQMVEQNMGPRSRGQGGDGGSGKDGGQGSDAQTQASRNQTGRVPGQTGPEGAPGADAASTGGKAAGTSNGTASGGGTAAAGGAAAGAGVVGAGIQILDGVNDAVQSGSGQMGGGNQQ
ncbi:TrbL/VirB6 plasmid conjugal transfer protein OS=Streptomyces fumanus OX=67302 GN=GCM10018772_70830 PE=4 SV=1 [Streptomyces fumanus]|uniref:TrbL/VirB6 plasmid conjugal transfer protein n=1 Tax=Streptomyces fumanus TaxID=67302 RepID=A0A919AZY0_9ACTN|nr:hypothetical protein [Streptomyces fumanus]GHF35119.1 hypothetical protein GCM10018772_70830 [Streptomyces fumanus]